MYGLPSDFDSSFFIGRALVQVCFSSNQVSFLFEGDIGVIVEGSFCHKGDGIEGMYKIPVTTCGVMRLSGLTVRTATSSVDGTLSLGFDEGQALTFHDDSANYESYHIRRGESEIHV